MFKIGEKRITNPDSGRMSCLGIELHFSTRTVLLINNIRTTIATEWVKKARTVSLAKKMVSPPTAAGSGINFQNDVLPVTFLDEKCE